MTRNERRAAESAQYERNERVGQRIEIVAAGVFTLGVIIAALTYVAWGMR